MYPIVHCSTIYSSWNMKETLMSIDRRMDKEVVEWNGMEWNGMEWNMKQNGIFRSVQFSSVTQSCLTLCDPMNRSMPGLPAITNSRSSLKLMPIESVIPSSHLSLCHPLLLLPPIPPSISVFPVSQLFA